ncbi:hypothetical protein CDL15_Pgr000364 [Punica granatum]|uniref:Uncharacterized protein n=1 Tax=Punica granatum TaxID=22663 RepID=A0A218XSD2_PUNGR|nr:hypothetical protein CDL15_Pgr000364 [Punica granatum]PKI32767.1 hypothetical protein CRG98_046841 [Punica granatum]
MASTVKFLGYAPPSVANSRRRGNFNLCASTAGVTGSSEGINLLSLDESSNKGIGSPSASARIASYGRREEGGLDGQTRERRRRRGEGCRPSEAQNFQIRNEKKGRYCLVYLVRLSSSMGFLQNKLT